MNTHKMLVMLLACLHITPYVSAKKATTAEEKKTINFDEDAYNLTRIFAETLQTSKQKHYNAESTPLESAFYKSFESFLCTLDPHSSFLDPKTYKAILETTSGEFFGIGIIIDNTRQPKDKFLVVVDTIPDGPADKAGLKPLDKIIEIDGESLEGMSTDEATSKLKGERTTKVHIKAIRDNQPDIIALDIARDEIKEQNSTCFYLPDQKIYYISLNMFSENSTRQVEKLLNQLKKAEYKGLILDLRNNSGGLLTSAIDIAGLFLDKGSMVVSTKGKGNKETQRYATSKAPIVNNAIPLFILINSYTASAAEILAGSLKIHSDILAQKAGKKEQRKLMVFLIGTRTFGKGSVQEVIPISNNCAIKVTTSLYYLPQDTSIQGVGIEPDFTIEKQFPPSEQMVWFNKFYGKERALANYIKSENSGALEEKEKQEKKEPKKEKNWNDRAKDMLEKDNQFRETISLINLFHTAQECCPANVSNRSIAVNFMKKTFITNDPLTLTDVKI